MLKKIKKIGIVVLCLAVAFSAVGCTNLKNNYESAPKTTTETTIKTTQTTTETTTPEQLYVGYNSKTVFSEKELIAIDEKIKNGDTSYQTKYALDPHIVDGFADSFKMYDSQIVDGDIAYYYDITKVFKTPEEMETYFITSSMNTDTIGDYMFFSTEISFEQAWFSCWYDEFAAEFASECVFEVKLPYKVTQTNGEILDDNTVRFDMLKLERVLYIVTEKSNAEWTKQEDKISAIKKLEGFKGV